MAKNDKLWVECDLLLLNPRDGEPHRGDNMIQRCRELFNPVKFKRIRHNPGGGASNYRINEIFPRLEIFVLSL